MDPDLLLADLLAGRTPALARAISVVENGRPGFERLLAGAHPSLGRARRIGVTGPPGAGKSTLVERLVAAYRADPLVHHGKPTLALGLGIVGQFAVLPERARGLKVPLLLQHGTADTLVDPAGTRLLATVTRSADTTVRWYDGLWHEIYNEPERAQPLADLREWLAARR